MVIGKAKAKCSMRELFQYHFIHHKSHIDCTQMNTALPPGKEAGCLKHIVYKAEILTTRRSFCGN
jgi:hypothetical protein